jgi:hypothetical protein
MDSPPANTLYVVFRPVSTRISDISYTVVPEWVKIFPHFEHDSHSTFWSLAMLAFPDTRNANLKTPSPSPHHGVSLPPNEHLVCYDYLYYVAAYKVGIITPSGRSISLILRSHTSMNSITALRGDMSHNTCDGPSLSRTSQINTFVPQSESKATSRHLP